MGVFAGKSWRDASATPAARARSSKKAVDCPAGFDAVVEAWVAGVDASPALDVVGRSLARQGLSLAQALDDLRLAASIGGFAVPAYDDVRVLTIAWSEETLSHLHHLSCEDPLTGLSSLSHLRSRVSELFRDQSAWGWRVRETHVLVVVELPTPTRSRVAAFDELALGLRLTGLAETARGVFVGSEVIARVGRQRIAVLAPRSDRLARKVALLRRLAESDELGGARVRVWLEGLPSNDQSAGAVLDELARA